MQQTEPFFPKVSISQIINNILYQKYSKFKYSYSLICINNLISHEKCRIVAKFKDYLVYDDSTEFLHEFCKKKNLVSRLKYIFNFYNSYSKIYPNYLIIPENKFLYKNIRKKQKIIDEVNAIKYCTPKYKNKNKKIFQNKNDINFFNKSIIESINELNKSSTIKKNNNSKEIKFNNILSSVLCSDIKNSHNLFNKRKSYNINIKQNIEENIYEINDISLNTQSSSIIKNDFLDDNTKSKASITEILNLINGKNKNLNNINININKHTSLNNRKYEKIKSNKNKKLKFLMLDINYIKKNIKTYKPKLSHNNNIKTEENIFNNKKNKNNEDQNIVHKQTVSCLLEDISKVLNNKNKVIQKKNVNILNKLNINKINKDYYSNNNLAVKTITSFGNIYNRKNKINEIKNVMNNHIKNKYKISRKNNSKNKKSFVSKNTINTTFNYGNTLKKIKNINDNENNNNKICQKNNIKKIKYDSNNNNNNILKTIEILISRGDIRRKSNLYKEKDLKKIFKLDSESFQSTQVSLNKKITSNNNKSKPKKNNKYLNKILTQIKNAIKNINQTHNNLIHNTTFSSLSKKYYTEHSLKNFKEKINSYECKPFQDYFKQNNNKKKIKKQRTSTLINKNKILNFFTSKDFYDLKIDKISFTKKNIIKEKNSVKKMRIYKDLNIVDSNSFLLKTFNKENNKDNFKDNIKDNKDKKIKKNNTHNFNMNKFKKNYYKYLCTITIKHLSCDKTNILCNLNKRHKKNNTMNICKNIEEIEKMKNEKIMGILKIGKRNKIKINSLNRNKNNNLLKYKTPSKTLIKSLEIKKNKTINNINNNTHSKNDGYIIKDKFNMNNHFLL